MSKAVVSSEGLIVLSKEVKEAFGLKEGCSFFHRQFFSQHHYRYRLNPGAKIT